MAITAAQRTQVSQLYVALFGRAPDAEGLNYWAGLLDGGTTAQQVANVMFGTTPARTYYPSNFSNEQIIAAFYQNVLGRPADKGGLDYWTGQLAAPNASFGTVVVRMIDVVANYIKPDNSALSQQGDDSKNLFNNRTSVAQYYGEKGGNVGNATNVLTSVTKDSSSVAPAKSAVDALLAAPSGTPIATPALRATAALETPVDTNFNDPLFGSQWNLVNTGQRYTDAESRSAALAKSGGKFLDINVLDAWKMGYTGKGITQSVSDDGFDLAHEDVQANLLKDKTYNARNGASGAAAFSDDASLDTAKSHKHGTVVGTIAADQANNGKGIVGVAFDSKLAAVLVLPQVKAGTNGNADLAASVRYINDTLKADVSLNSYGADPAFSEDYNIAPGTPDSELTANQKVGKAIADSAANGRDGKGVVYEFSAGNERGTHADSAMTNGTSSRYVIAVGAMDEIGNRSSYESRGTNILVSAFGGDGAGDQSVDAGFGIVAGDVAGAAGYNTNTASSGGNYSFYNTGTSYSGPTVGGVVALMLQANPNLGFRDVSNILALTARGVGETGSADQNKYVTNGATDWNLGGMHHSDEGVGFGLVDATAAVRLAEQWALAGNAATRGTVANWKSLEASSAQAAGLAIADGAATGTSVSATLSATPANSKVRIERMEFDINLKASAPGELKAVIVSPAGTQVTIFDQPRADTAWPGTFTVGSTAFLGENAAGTWTLKLYDVKTGGMVDASYQSFTVRAWGSAVTDDSQYLFTREYTATGKVLSDTIGTDTINAAAVHKAVSINLNAGQTSSIGNDSATPGTFTIASGSTIENAIGGGGSDTLVGNGANNLLKGSWGDDTLSGGGGDDTLVGGQGADNLTGGAGNDLFVITEDSSASTSSFLGDVITDFTSGQDHLQFSSLSLTRLAGWKGNTAGLTGQAGAQGASFLVAGTRATGDFAQMLFDSATGRLSLDLDGTGALPPVQLVTLTGTTTLLASDLTFVA